LFSFGLILLLEHTGHGQKIYNHIWAKEIWMCDTYPKNKEHFGDLVLIQTLKPFIIIN